MGDTKIRLLLDLDTGIDDALALAYALGSPEVELVGVVSSYGNVTTETAARNTRALLELLGHPEVPVCLGRDRPLRSAGPYEPGAGAVRIHGRDGLGDVPAERRPFGDAERSAGAARAEGRTENQAENQAEARAEKRQAPAALPELLGEPGIRYVPTGPLTNLAAALAAEPALAGALPRVTFMGGALAVPGNVTPCSEANVHSDPESADAVLRSGLKTRMIGLDVTHQVILTREETAAWRGSGTPAGRFFADMTDHYIGVSEKGNPQMGGCALHDPLAVAAAIDPTLVGCLPANLRVDLDGATRGRTVCDPARLRDAEKDCDVALTVDAPRFVGEFSRRVRRALGVA